MLNSVVKLSRVRPGFDADHLLTFRVALTGSNYDRRAVTASRSCPDLLDAPRRDARRAAARRSASIIPFGGQRGANGFEIEGRPADAGRDADRGSASRLAGLLPDDEHSDRRRAAGFRRPTIAAASRS
mgnify:CR=1 FL=1